MTTPQSPSTAAESFEEKLAHAQQRDPLDEVEQARRDGWPDRWPNNLGGSTNQGD